MPKSRALNVAHRTPHTLHPPGSLKSQVSRTGSDDMAPSPRLPPRSTTIIISAPRAFFSFPFPALALAFPLPYCELVKARTYAHTHTQNTDPLFSLCFLFFCLLLPSALRSSTTPTSYLLPPTTTDFLYTTYSTSTRYLHTLFPLFQERRKDSGM